MFPYHSKVRKFFVIIVTVHYYCTVSFVSLLDLNFLVSSKFLKSLLFLSSNVARRGLTPGERNSKNKHMTFSLSVCFYSIGGTVSLGKP